MLILEYVVNNQLLYAKKIMAALNISSTFFFIVPSKIALKMHFFHISSDRPIMIEYVRCNCSTGCSMPVEYAR